MAALRALAGMATVAAIFVTLCDVNIFLDSGVRPMLPALALIALALSTVGSGLFLVVACRSGPAECDLGRR